MILPLTLAALFAAPQDRLDYQLRYRAPALPFWLSLCGVIAIAATAAAGHMRARSAQGDRLKTGSR